MVGAVSFSLLATVLHPLEAQAVPEKTGEVRSRPDSLSAALTARSTGHRVEDLSQRSESTQVFANPDSTWTLESYTAPKFAQHADGSWVEARKELVQAGNAVVADVAGGELELSGGENPSDGVADLAKLKGEDSKGKAAEITLGWEGSLPKPVVENATADYPKAAAARKSLKSSLGAGPKGADVRVEKTRSGFSHSVVLPEKPTTAPVFRFPLKLTKGLKAAIVPGTGAIEVKDSSGKLVFFAPRPKMWDSRIDPASGLPVKEEYVPTTLETVGGVQTLVLSAPQSFFEDPAVKYPVTIDPTWSTQVTTDTWVQTDATSPMHGSTELRAGTWDGGVHKARSYLQFPTTALNGKKILDAKLQLNNYWSYSCTGANVYVQRVTGAWNSSTLVWGNQPSATTVGQLPLATAKGFSSSCPAGNVYFPVTPTVQTWADTPSSNYGVRILGGNESDSYTWRRYTSANVSTADIASEPHLQVTYNSYPNSPTSPTIDTAQTTTWTDPAIGTTRYVNTRKPKLSAIVSDPDGGTVKGLWTLTTGTTKTWNQIAGTTVASGGRSILTPGTTTPALAEGATYSIDIVGNDGSLSTKTPFRHTVFTVDSVAPAAPTVTASNLTNGQWADPKPASNTFTFTGSSSDTVKFEYSKDGAAYVAVNASGSPAKATLSWVADGSHSLSVRSVDKAGNRSGITTFTYGAGSAALTAPLNEAKSTDLFTVKASSPTATAGTVTPTVYWRQAGGSEPSDFSSTNGSKTGWTSASTLPAISAGASVNVNYKWSAQAAADSVGKGRVPALLDLQVCFAYTSPAMTRCTHTSAAQSRVSVLKLPHAFGNGFPTSAAGPGQVALWTGEFNTSETDASISVGGTGLQVSRSYSSLAGLEGDSVFGPGWKASFGIEDAGVADVDIVDNTRFDGTLALVSGDGEALIYRQPGNGRVQAKPGIYSPVGDGSVTGDVVELTGAGADARISIKDDSGTTTVFAPVSFSAGVDTQWAPVTVTEPGSAGTTSFSRDPQGRITRILAPVPTGVTCAATGTLNAGCRALNIEYAQTTTATAESPGDIQGQVKSISFHAFNPSKPGGAGMDTVKVTDFAYDVSKKLVRATDSRSGRADAYEYSGTSASGAPLLSRIIPAGKAGYTFGYGPASQSATSLLTVHRDSSTGTGAAVQLSRYVYGLNPAQTNSDLPSLATADVALWSQSSAPVYGAAVFSADKPVGTSDPTMVSGADWKYASLTYADEQGYVVNSAEYGSGAWQLTATDYLNGNITREFTPGAIAALRNEAAAQNLPTGSTLGTHGQFASITRYNKDIKAATDVTLSDGRVITAGTVLTPAGTLVTDRWTPAAPVGSTGELARLHTHTDFDQGAPNQGVNLSTGTRYNLPTTTTTTSAASTSGSPDPDDALETGEPVVSQQLKGYDPIDSASATGPTSGWTLGAQTTETVVMEDPTKNQTTKTRFDDRGRAVETRKPASNGADAGTKLVSYFSAGAAADGCGSKPQWAGLPCLTRTAEVTQTKPAAKNTAFTMFLDKAASEENLGTVTRTTTTTFTAAGDKDTTKTVVSGLVSSTPVPASKTVYDPATGEEIAKASLNASGQEISRTSTAFDKWGRVTSYTDATGAVTTTAYTPAGEPASIASPHGTVNYVYDGTDSSGREERRGKATSMSISGAGVGGGNGTFTASYGADGSLIAQSMPGGITQTREYTVGGMVSGLSYSGKTTTDGNSSVGPWVSWSRDHDVLGRVIGESTPDGTAFVEGAAPYDRAFSYDRASRLVQVVDRTEAPGRVLNTDPAEGPTTPCIVKKYTFDQNGNRTGTASGRSGEDGVCPQAPSPSSSGQWGYDSADRVQSASTSSGAYVYDALGRQTSIPAADTTRGPTATSLALAYFDTDAAKSITQSGVTTSFTLDPEGRRASATSGTSSTINGYHDSTDSPGWVTESSESGGSKTTRYESSIGGDLGVTVTGGLVKLAIVNPHQDVVATVTLPNTGDAEGLDSWSNYDEYGLQLGTTPNTGASTYGWVGAHQRATDSSGLILMGARLYNPLTGLFTSVDPVEGGNTTDYAYPQDPVNKYDTTGEAFWFLIPIAGRILWSACVRYCATAGRAIAQTFKKNNILRIGPPTKGAPFRVSVGAARKYWTKMNPVRRNVQRAHVHIERRGVAATWHTSARSYTWRYGWR
ncbi:DNRLRE domain-containing protein [Arthrobacter woluwensis]|uniref:DNRLRE domain-containing protein n=1 Tax=Arthrobacter woluwensis TaxID=156980 RepID=UPI00382CAF13